MDITLTVESDRSGADLRALEDWFRRNPRLRPVRFSRPVPVPRPGELGGTAAEIIQASLETGAAALVLAEAAGTWLRSRAADIKVRVTSPRGTVEVTAGDADEAVALISRLLEGLPEPAADETP